MKRSILWILCLLLLAIATLAAVHLTTRTQNAEGTILLNGKETAITDLELHYIEGTVINGKGEEKELSVQGILLIKLCDEHCTRINVTADDEYTVSVQAVDFDRAYLYISDEGDLRLAVFGDGNSKRNVKNVLRVDWT